MTDVGGEVFFSATDGNSPYELWKSDGTKAGTQLVKAFDPTGTRALQFFTAVDGELFFEAQDATNTARLWKTDGTADGTVQVSSSLALGNGVYHRPVNVNGQLVLGSGSPVTFTGRFTGRRIEVRSGVTVSLE